MGKDGNFFKVSRKGYDVAAVDAFVAAKAQEEAERSDLIAALEARVGQLNSQVEVLGEEAEKTTDLHQELESLRTTSEQQKATIAELEKQVAGVKDQEEALKLTLASATKTRDEIIAAAEEELANARNVAQGEAERILSEANARASDINGEVDRLTADARAEADRLTAEAQAEAERVKADATAAAEALHTQSESEAARTLAEANAQAESTLSNAKAEAESTLAEAKTEADEIVQRSEDGAAAQQADLAEQLSGLAAQHADALSKLERLRTTYRTLADQLETIVSGGVDALVEGAASISLEIEANPAPVVPSSPTTESPEVAPAVAESTDEAVPTFEPADDVPPAPVAAEPEPTDALPEPVDAMPEPADALPEPAEHPSLADALRAAADQQTTIDDIEDVEPETAPALESVTPVEESDAVETVFEPSDHADDGDAEETIETEAASAEVADTEFEPEADAAPDADSASEAEETNEDGESDDEFWNPPTKDGGERGSFYSRRSGRLPRLGADASRGAMSAALGMRLTNEDD